MALAGLEQRRMQGDRVSLETLIARPPAVLLRSDYRQGQYSTGQRWLAHTRPRGEGGPGGRSRPMAAVDLYGPVADRRGAAAARGAGR